MPKRTDIHSILIIGAGPIVIGQACEFDYSGAQACKALREEGFRVILVNSNPATIMTDPEMADATYIEPIDLAHVVERIIERERPDALLPTMGGQTALNCALDLAREGVLERYGVEMIGASREAIDKAEDRDLFRQAMRASASICPRSASRTAWRRRSRCRRIGFPDHHPAVLHHGRQRRRHRLQPRGVRGDLPPRPRPLAHLRAADRGVGARLEGVRDGGGARPARTTASSSAPSRTSTPWACTPATRSPWRRRRR
jgi:hypothetical protein